MTNNADLWKKAECGQKEKQDMFYRWKIFGKEEDGFMKTDIGILLFSQVELNPDDPPPLLSEYHTLYNKTKQVTIRTIAEKIRNIFPPPSQVSFGVTFLTALFDKCEETKEFVIFRCAHANQFSDDVGAKKPPNVFFIDPSGRVYKNWKDFVDSNKLPRCKYLAPDDGVYKPNGCFKKFISPEANKGFILQNIDKVMTAACFGVIGAGIFSVAAVPATVTGIAVSVYGTGQSMMNLRDRYRHSESIKPNNMEAILSYFNIVTSGVTGLSSAAMAYQQQILNRLGRWGPLALKTMNISVLCLDATGLILNSYIFSDKLRSGELTMMDTFNLVLQVYLIHGQVCRTIELHQILSSSNTTALPQRLTKSQKRNLRKRRAKAAKRGRPMSGNTVKVTEANTFESMKLIARCLGKKPVEFLRKHYTYDQIVTEFLNSVRQLISCLWKKGISIKNFLLNLPIHIENLVQILIADIDRLKRYSNWFNDVFNMNATLDANIVGTAFNGFQNVNNEEDNITEELELMIEQIPDTAHDSIARDENSSTSDCIAREIDVKMILNAVKGLLSKCIVHENPAKLLVFAEGVKYVQSVLITELVEKYDVLFESNMAVLKDPNMVTKALETYGIKIDDNFFPSLEELEEKLSEAVEKVSTFVETSEYAIGIRDEGDVVASTNMSLWDQISNEVVNLYALILPIERCTGLQQSLDILARATNFYVTEKVAQFDKLKGYADELFHINANNVGPAKAHQILANVGMSVNTEEIAIKCVNTELDDAQICQLQECCPCATSAKHCQKLDEFEAYIDSTEDEFLITLTMYTCSVFMRKIGPLDDSVDDPKKLLKKVLQFVTYRFARDTSHLKNTYSQLEYNVNIQGPAKYKVFLQKLKAHPQKNKVTLQRAAQVIMDCDDKVVDEYFVFCNSSEFEPEMDNVNFWQSLADEEGLRVKITDKCCTNLSDVEYRDLAMRLFHKEIDTEFSVEKDENKIVLKCQHYIVTFNFYEDIGSWLVILADQRVNQNND